MSLRYITIDNGPGNGGGHSCIPYLLVKRGNNTSYAVPMDGEYLYKYFKENGYARWQFGVDNQYWEMKFK